MLSFFASSAGLVSRSGPIVALVPAGLKVWQAPQPLETNTDFPCTALPAAAALVVVAAVVAGAVVGGAAAVVVAAVVACVVVGAAAAAVTVTVRVTVRFPPAVSRPIAQPANPAGTSSVTKSSHRSASPALALASRRFGGAMLGTLSRPPRGRSDDRRRDAVGARGQPWVPAAHRTRVPDGRAREVECGLVGV